MKKLVLVVTLASALALTACSNSATNGNVTNTVASNNMTDAVTDAMTDAVTDAMTDAVTDAMTDAVTDVSEDVEEIIEETESSVTEEVEVADTTDEVTEPEVEEEPTVHECKNAEPLSPDAVVDYSATYIDGTRYDIGKSLGWVYLNDEQMFNCEDLVIGNKDSGDACVLSEVLKESELDKSKFIKDDYGFYEYNSENMHYELSYKDGTLSYLTAYGAGDRVINGTECLHLNDLVEEFGKPYILRYNSFGYKDAECFSPEYGESAKQYAYAYRIGDYIISYRVEYTPTAVDEVDLSGCTVFNINAYDNIEDIISDM